VPLAEFVNETVSRLRVAGTDTTDVEVKTAHGSPRSLASTVSAFSNGDGGLILWGLSESAGFTPVSIDAHAMAVKLAGVCRDEIVPAVNAEIDIVQVDGQPVVAAAVPAGLRELKPFYVRTQGIEKGAYIRGWDGDRHLTTYEVHALLAGRGQPRDDAAPVAGASLADLDSEAVDALLTRLKATRGEAFAEASAEQALEYVRVLDRAGGEVRVTLAGLLTLGRYPQQFFPQLNVTFVSFATPDGRPMADGTRFLDNVVIDGPIPAMITRAVDVVRRNMTRRAVVVGVGRTDYWEYPEEAVRELIANALMHREYHPLAHGSQVRVELYPDRLEVVSPGGLFGAFRPDVLGAETVTSSRNAVLGRLLEDIRLPGVNRMVCENRGTGLLAVSATLRDSGLEPVTIHDTLSAFRAVLYREPILDEAATAWLDALPLAGINRQQRLGLAYLRRQGTITHLVYRALTGQAARSAAKDLEDLAARGLAIRDNLGRTALWRLNPTAAHATSTTRTPLTGRQRDVIVVLSSGPRSTAAIADQLGVTPGAIRHHLQDLAALGVVAPTVNKRSPLNKWVLVQPDDRPSA